jgi:hypothetical protein
MGRRESLAARSFSAGCGRDTASRAPPGFVLRRTNGTPDGSYSPTAERLMLWTSPALFYEVRKDYPDTTHSL